MSEFTVSDTHSGVRVSITVNIAPDAKYVEASALHLIPQVDDFASKVRAAARTAASNGIWPIAADVVNAINECASQARTREAAALETAVNEAVRTAVTAERERATAANTEELNRSAGFTDSLIAQVNSLQDQLAAKAKRSAARARGARK